MPCESLSLAQKIQRWMGLVVGTVVAAIAVRSQVASGAEVFWILFPLWLVIATRGLRLFPFPQQRTQSRVTQIAINNRPDAASTEGHADVNLASHERPESETKIRKLSKLGWLGFLG